MYRQPCAELCHDTPPPFSPSEDLVVGALPRSPTPPAPPPSTISASMHAFVVATIVVEGVSHIYICVCLFLFFKNKSVESRCDPI
jgi:hypothetical protein